MWNELRQSVTDRQTDRQTHTWIIIYRKYVPSAKTSGAERVRKTEPSAKTSGAERVRKTDWNFRVFRLALQQLSKHEPSTCGCCFVSFQQMHWKENILPFIRWACPCKQNPKYFIRSKPDVSTIEYWISWIKKHLKKIVKKKYVWKRNSFERKWHSVPLFNWTVICFWRL